MADAVLADLYKPEYVSAELIEKIAYAPRIKRWKELGIMWAVQKQRYSKVL